MSASPPACAYRSRHSPGTWLRRHPYTVGAAVVLAVLSLSFLTRREPEWEKVFLQAAHHLRQGADLYDYADAYLYPPFMAFAIVPLTFLPGSWHLVVWLGINLLALLVLVRSAWSLAGGGSLEGTAPASWREHLAACVGLVCGVCFLQNSWAHRQTDIVIAAAVMIGCLLLVRGRDLAGAVCLGLAAACKCTPLLFAPYLLWRRRFGAAACLVGVAVGVNLLPDLVSRPASGQPWLVEYGSRHLAPLASPRHYTGSWGSDIVYNQSLAGAGQRWLGTTWHWRERDCTLTSRLEAIHPLLLRGVVSTACLAVLLGSLLACGAPLRQQEGPPLSGGVPVVAVECGVVVLLALLLSPMSSKAHFGVLLLPGFCLARVAVHTRDRFLGGLLTLAVLLAVVSNKDLIGNRLYTLTLWYGTTTWLTLLLLAGSWVVLCQRRA